MPVGIICQLHYTGGGYLHHQDLSGDVVLVPFRTAASQLRIGQQVAFDVRAGEAVDLQAGKAFETNNPNP